MKTQTKTTPKSLIAAHFKLPDNIRFYAGAATNDLYNGPRNSYEDDEFPYLGFTHAVKTLRDWADKELPREIWIDMDCEQILDKLPEGEEIDGNWVEPYLENTYHLESREILSAIFGKELASYL